METSNSGSNLSIEDIEANIRLITEVMPSVSSDDRVYYEGVLNDLHRQLEHTRSQLPIAGSSNGYSQHHPHRSFLHAQQMPSPPVRDTSMTRKHSLGPIDWPQAKRVSNQPSPITPNSDIHELPYATSSRTRPERPAVQVPFIDLTLSNTPSPYSGSDSPAGPPRHNAVVPDFVFPNNMLQGDPFPELNNAFQPYSAQPPHVSNWNQDFMSRTELSTYLSSPAPTNFGYEFQNMDANNIMNRAVPYTPNQKPRWVDFDSSEDEYGDFPITGAEGDAIEKLFENIGHQEAAPKDREPTPKMMSCTLKEYQKIGLTWMLKMENSDHKGGILADEMGLGKTVQALALICANPPKDQRFKTTLIIAPVALMRQWQKEIERHILPQHKLKVYMYHGAGKKASWSKLRTYDVVLTTFGTLSSEYKRKDTPRETALVEQELRNPDFRRAGKDELSLVSKDSMFHRIIIDEAHNIKNRNAICSKATEHLQAHHRLCMTGTPMMNSVDELYPLLRFLKLQQYLEWGKFNYEIAKLVKEKNEVLRKRGMSRLQILLKSVMLRRQKTSKVDGMEICTIPAKHVRHTTTEFNEDEKNFYQALEQKTRLQFNKYAEKGVIMANYAQILVWLLRLRQACCHPHLIKDLSQAATSGIAEDELLDRAKQLAQDVVGRLQQADLFECPICLEADPNMTIIIPCGHHVCGECAQKLMDPSQFQDGNMENISEPRCPTCRGDLKAKFITDYKHFCKVHCPEKLDEEEDEDEDDESDSEDEFSDSDVDDDIKDEVDNRGNLADFVVDDDDDEEEEDTDDESKRGRSTGLDSDLDDVIQQPSRRKTKVKGKRKEKARKQPKKTLAQLKKESLRNRATKKRYLRRLDKTYIPSAKTSKTVNLLEEIKENDPTEKTLIFSQFTSFLDLLEVPLYRKRIPYQRYDGSMKMDERADAVTAFMDDPNMNVMLVSLKAGNAGLNLWKASQVIILDPFWNPFIEDQAVDRAHRMPQPREVTVHRILIPDTVEDRICAIMDRKREIIGTALDEEASKSLSRLGVADLRFLFGVG